VMVCACLWIWSHILNQTHLTFVMRDNPASRTRSVRHDNAAFPPLRSQYHTREYPTSHEKSRTRTSN
jgi:hypothetical protein